MRLLTRRPPAFFYLTALLALALMACQTATNTNTNTNTANLNATPAANANNTPGAQPAPGASIEAREPDKYQATIKMSAQTTGSGQNIAIPALTAEVARSGVDRRFSFVLPGGEEVIYLDRADKRYIILPKRKQYAELTPESTGFEVPQAMTVGEIVNRVKNMQGFERAGEENVNGRTAVKYRYAGTSQTGTQAGEVKTESIVLIDKDTGLPLRSETVAQSQSGNVKGVTGLNFVTEMSNIKTEVDAKMFELPQGLSKISDQQVKQSVDAVGRAVVAIFGQLMQTANSNSSATASPTASGSASPAGR